MAEESIERISFEISGDASAAVRNINNLVAALGRLEKRVGSSATKLLEVSRAMDSLKRASSGLDATGLKELGNLKLSVTVAKNLERLVGAVNALPQGAAVKLAELSYAMTGLRNASVPKGSVDQLARIPVICREFQGFDMGTFTGQLRELNTQLAPLAANIDRLATAYAKLPKSMQTAGLAARSVASSNKYLKGINDQLVASNKRVEASFGNVTFAMSGVMASAAKLTAAYHVFRRVFQATIGEVNTYIENMNLFEASMGKYTESATKYGQKIQDALGIDFGQWARNQGVFQTLITGMGDTADRAAVMSQQLTQLGYDISSFYNISVEDAMLKLQSGMAGELEPLRRLGWDLSNARMQVEAYNLGIEKKVANMTQAEKVALRYHMIMTQVTQTHGDMARTIASPANQLRVLQAQLTLAARAIGNLFIPALNMILPVVIAVVKAIRLLAEEIAGVFGIDAKFEVDYSTVDYSGMNLGEDEAEDAADAWEDAEENAKKYKNTVMGFDELNKLNAPTESTKKDKDEGDGSGAKFDLPLETYDFLAGLTDDITKRTDEMAEHIKNMLPWIAAVGAGLLAWKIASGLGAGLTTCLGLLMAVAGAVILVYNWLDAWNNGVGFENLTVMLVGIGLLVAGLALIFGTVGAAIGLVVGGLALLSVGFKDVWENGFSLEGLIAVFGGIALVVAGLALAFGPVGAAIGVIIGAIALLLLGFKDLMENGFSLENFGMITAGFVGIGAAIGFLIGGPIGALIGAVIGLVAAIVTAIVTNWDWLCENIFNPIGDWINTNVIQPVAGFFSGLGEFLTGLWDSIVNTFWTVWGAVAGWMNDNVIQPIIAFWTPIINWFSQLWNSISATAQAMWHNIGVFADGCWQIVVRVWQVASGWFDKNVVQPVTRFFTTLWNTVSTAARTTWNTISGVWRVVSNWFNVNVIQPVTRFFANLWSNFVTGAQNAWQGIQRVFSGLATFFGNIFSNAWQQIISVFQYGGQIFNGVVNAIVNAFKYVVNQLISGLNWAIAQPFNGLNSILSAMRNWECLGIYPFAGFWDVPVPQIPKLAEGRYGINTGQLFVARERGPEMVGQMGSHTTVANNQQIVQGIEQGVMSAMVRVMAMNESASSREMSIEIPLYIGNEEIARATWRGEASLVRRGELKPRFA